MTSFGLRESLPDARPVPQDRGPRRGLAGLRLVGLHLVSRRVPATLVALAACAVVLRAALSWHWIGGADAQQLPLLIEAGVAAFVGVACGSPFGEPERATGRWLPYLRFGAALALTGAAFAALTVGSAAAHLPGGNLDVLRNVAGLAGIGLLSAAVLGGALAWVGPMAYAVVGEVALSDAWRTPWTWPARPPHDLGAALCAGLVFAAGMAVITVRGARDSVRE